MNSRTFQIVLFAALSILFATGTVTALLHPDYALAGISFVCMILNVCWLYVVLRDRPQQIEPSKYSVIGAHVQDTTLATGSVAQFVSFL